MNPPRFIDTHCHFDFPPLLGEEQQSLRQAAAGIERIVVPSVAAARFADVLALAERHPMLHAALGLHPIAIEQHQDADVDLLEQHLRQHREMLTAVGEIGLDTYMPQPQLPRQLALLAAAVPSRILAPVKPVMSWRDCRCRACCWRPMRLICRCPVTKASLTARSGSARPLLRYAICAASRRRRLPRRFITIACVCSGCRQSQPGKVIRRAPQRGKGRRAIKARGRAPAGDTRFSHKGRRTRTRRGRSAIKTFSHEGRGTRAHAGRAKINAFSHDQTAEGAWAA